jgi:hypothetical protein
MAHRVLRTKGAAEYIGLKTPTLEKFRLRGEGHQRCTGAAVGVNSRELFGRHLGLSRLRHGQRGLVACIFHKDRTPSLSEDVAAGVFNCCRLPGRRTCAC